MAGREAVGARVLGDVVEPDRLGLRDQQPEDAVSTGQVPDGLVHLWSGAAGEELRQLAAPVVKHADGGVAGAGQFARCRQDAVEQRIQVELGRERLGRLQQARETALVVLLGCLWGRRGRGRLREG
jgi:hypothetical protein